MRTTAANVAARQAVGGSDMLSKWQLMAEQARQKRAPIRRSAHGSGKGSAEQNEASKRSHFAAFGTGKGSILTSNYFHTLILRH
jgi:transcription initiation factor TFIID subunit 4